MNMTYESLVKIALKVYSEKLRGLEDQTAQTRSNLDRVMELRTKKNTSDETGVKIEF